jgi:hypothetical protein
VLRDFRKFQLGTNLVWSPARELDIGVEVMYDNLALRGGPPVLDQNKFGFRFTRMQDQLLGRLRIQRDF